MRWVSFLVLLSLGPAVACSRPAQKKSPAPGSSAATSEAAAFGPRVLADGSAASNVVAEPPSAGLPIVDAPALLQKIRDSGQRGVVVNAWASWCDPCRDELPMLARVAPKLAAQGVPIWLVSVDDPDGFAAAHALLESLHIALPSFAAAPPLSDFKAGVNPHWPGMIPVSFLFDATGTLRYFWPGEVYEKELVPIVEGFVAGKHIDGTANFGLAPGATRGSGHE
jgi:thiol-disulfide isomerase/thioredoxin